MQFTPEQNERYRAVFVEESYQKAWGAVCNAELIGKNMLEVVEKMKEVDDEKNKLIIERDEIRNGLEAHTPENRDKVNELGARITHLANQEGKLKKYFEGGNRAATELHQTALTNLGLAEFALTWTWENPEDTAVEENGEQEESGV